MTVRYLHAATAAALPGGAEPPGEILLLPAGEVRTRPHDGRRPWWNPDADAVVAATRDMRLDLPIDYEHQAERAKANGQPAPAAGWIKRVFAHDGAIWGAVEWNKRAATMIRAREYRFTSATFQYRRDNRRVVRITGAALVNDPALYMSAIAGAQTEDEEVDMDLAKLRKALGLAATATEAEILAAAELAAAGLAAVGTALGLEGEVTGETATAALTAQQTGLGAIRTAAGLGEDATLAQIETAVKTVTASASTANPGEFVPRAEFDRVKTDLAALQADGAKAAASTAVDDAIAAGKVAPASRDWALGYASKDPAGFAEFVKDAPAILPNGRVAPATAAPGSDVLSAEEKAVCRATGVSEEDFLKSRKALAAAGEAED